VAYLGTPVDGPSTVYLVAPLIHGHQRPEARALRADGASTAPVLAGPNISVGEPFSLTGWAGRPVYGVFYAPALGGTGGPPGSRPPLIVACHGGPTGSAGRGFDVVVQYFTSRGFAYAAVDYAGSTGYGRAYRCSLWGQWGVADAQDCASAAQHLASSGRVDPDQMAVRGSSSGGLTALNALAAGDGFAAAVAWYGVTDLLGLAAGSHDFEARYLDRLIGPLPGSRELYQSRSPIGQAARLEGSVLLLQGTEDPVVPPAQAEALRETLAAAGRHCVVRLFEGEGHGFRRSETLVAALEEELAFYRRELGLGRAEGELTPKESSPS
jgi:dipeptidyl aminopeptidase/acylaminoacyl peptidase